MNDVKKVILISLTAILSLLLISGMIMFLSGANSKTKSINDAKDTAVIVTMKKEINEILAKSQITGVEAKKIIEYFKESTVVRVDLVNTSTSSVGIPQNYKDISSRLGEDEIYKIYKNIKSTHRFNVFKKSLSPGVDNIILTQI